MPGPERHLNVSGELLARCRAGEQDAFRELFAATVTDVHRILVRLVGPTSDQEDLVQQVYLALLGSLRRFEERSSFSTYLFGICLKVAKKRSRSLGRFLRLREAVAREPVPVVEPSQDLDRSRRATEVERALARLPFKQRVVLVLFEMEGLSGKETAARLGIPEATVWTRLHHAREAFRRSFRWESRSIPGAGR